MDDVFQGEKQIYKYPDGGGGFKFADPLVIQASMTQAAIVRNFPSTNAMVDAANKVDLKTADPIQVAEAGAALMALAESAIEVFGLVPFDPATGNGATPAFALGLLDHFHRFMQKKNLRQGAPPISTPASESTSATPPITDISSASA
jgi:hypothetical protein